MEAVLGTELTVETIYGEKKKLRVPAGSQSGDKIRLAKEGFYRLNSSEKGSQVVMLKVKVPTSLSSEEKDLYQQLRQLRK